MLYVVLYCVRVWDLESFGEQQQKLLPHPSFVYCSQFHPRVDTIVVTGGFDQVIRIWDIGDDDEKINVSKNHSMLTTHCKVRP